MSAVNLLNLNVDALFEQHSVPEIDIVHKKIQGVVEAKREELRTMVGERYRDLLQAADTIANMQECANGLIAQVESIGTNCRSLNEQQLIGFKTSDSADLLRNRQANKQLNSYFSTMVQIKLLTALPELIWSNIDRERFCVATELFIFSRHISTGLQLDAQNPLMQHLPVAGKQWEILKPFRVTIKQRLLMVLEREELVADVAADCLLSLLLLEKSSLNSVLQTFLQLRCAAFLACLSGKGATTGEVEKRRVKERILASLKLLNSTIELMGKCFLVDGVLLYKLREQTDPDAPPTIALMDRNDAQFAYMLPDIIANFKPKFDPQTLDNAQVHAAMEQWLSDTKRIASVQLKQLFELVDSMPSIQEIKHEAHSYKKHLNFEPIARSFQLQQSLDFYELKYAPLINQRVRQIIEDNWAQTVQHTFKMLQQALSELDTSTHYLWQEQTEDLPVSLEEALSEDRKAHRLLMRTKGYDSAIIELCTDFDSKIAAIVAELSVLLEEQATRAEEKLALVEFLRETAETQLLQLLEQVKALQLQQRGELFFVVRCCAALIELCPHLRICYCQQSSWRQWVGNVTGNSVEHWQRICQRFETEIYNLWQQILDSILAEQDCLAVMPATVTYDVMLWDFANWDTLTLEQKDEQDNTLHTNIHIPIQPRISLQSYLFSLVRSLSAAVPQTLPSKVLAAFTQKLLTQLLSHYTTLAADSHTAACQNVALQLYFDLKFLQGTFAPKREDRALNEQFYSLQSKLKEFIDPFDFELFAEHLNSNLKSAIARQDYQLGVLIPAAAAATHQADAATPSSVQVKDPHVVNLNSRSSTSLYFPLLPVMPTTGHAAESRRTAAAEKQTITPTRKITAGTSASAATQRKSETGAKAKSFFGAMSQEWFR